jgi:glycosyltransferase involved in cell wall biosynthesis
VRILHVTDRVGARGGAHRHLQGILRAQSEDGHDVHVASAAGEDAAPAGVRRHEVAGLDARGDRPADLQPTWELVRPDVVHLHTVVNPRVLEWAAGHRAVITIQDHRYFCPGRGKWTLEGEVCRTALSADACKTCFDDEDYFREVLGLTERRLRALRALHVVVLSQYMKDELVAAGLDPRTVDVVPPFVEGLDLAATADGPPCVLFAGRLTEHKGAREAVDAWRRSGVDLPLVVAGTGPLREELTRAGAEVLGWLQAPALSRAYRRARALLLPSRWQEPFGIAGLEALTMGVPVAAWESGGVREWHPGEGLVAWGDVAGLAAALRQAVGGPRAHAPRGFEREPLMARLEESYRRAGA